MFAYCGNNPVNRGDPSGAFWIELLVVGIIVGVSVCASGCSDNPNGAASPYMGSSSTNYNCYAYALGETEWKYVGGNRDAVKDYDVNNVAEMVLADAQRDGRSMRPIEAYNSPIESNEYRIALRTAVDDYHFMVQHDDGTWSHKPSICRTRLVKGDNPSEIPWDAPVIDGELWQTRGFVEEIDSIANYYDSRTLYFAVSK